MKKALINLGPLGGLVETEIGDIDLDAEVIELDGERLTEARAEEIAREISRRHGLKGGRPRLPAAERASVQKAVRLTPAQAKRLGSVAKDRGVGEAEIIRRALDTYLRDAS